MSISHETGHTEWLYHQAVVSGCTKINDYMGVQGTGVTSWEPIMGGGGVAGLSTWAKGKSNLLTDLNCYNNEDEFSVLNNLMAYKADGLPNTVATFGITYSPLPFGFTLTQTLEQVSDVDVFKMPNFVINLTKTVHVDTYGNLDVRLDYYTSAGVLWLTIDPSTTVNISQVVTFPVSMSGGYVKVSASSNNANLPTVPAGNVLTGKWKYSTTL